MKTLLKKTFLMGTTLVALLAVVACNEIDSTVENQPVDSSKLAKMEYSYENQSNILISEDGTNAFNWKKNRNGKSIFDANVTLNVADLQEMKVVKSTANPFTLAINDRNINFGNVSSDASNVSFDVYGNSDRMINFSLTDNNHDFTHFMDYVQNSTVISSEQKLWPLIFVGACLIASGVDSYCSSEIAENVASCTAAGQCSQVNSCSASCVTCGSQK
jgi:hypothetical protein